MYFIVLIATVGAIRRHHETKRKGYLDSLPARQEQVAKNKNKAKRKQMRSRVHAACCTSPHIFMYKIMSALLSEI